MSEKLFNGKLLPFIIEITKTSSMESIPLQETILALKAKLLRDVKTPSEEKADENRELEDQTAVETKDQEVVYDHAVLKPEQSRFHLVTRNFVDETTGEYRPRMIYKTGGESSEDEAAQREVDAEFGLDDNDLMSEAEFKQSHDGQTATDVVQSLKLEELFKPISRPSDIVTIPSISHTYKSSHLDKLADELIHVIEKEQDNVILLGKLMNVFLGDDPNRVLEADMELPEYDHNLDLDKQQATNNNPMLETKQQQPTSAIMAMNPNSDPFFMPPVYQSDPELNLELQDADEIRQLVQIALQRNEEFVRSLSQIRSGFVRATRLRDFVYQWCSEIHEEQIQQKE